MAKKGYGFGKFVAFATIAGAVAAGISYFTKYKSFHKELEENFHDFEDDGNDDISKIDSTMNRNYVSLNANKDELKIAASDMADAAKDAAVAAKNLVKDAANIVSDTAKEAASAMAFTAKDMFDSTLEKEETTEDTEDITEDGGLDYTAAQSLPVEEVAMTEPKHVTDSIKETSDDDTTTIEEDDIE
ncbi:hypothetical protein [Lacrimispora sp.]|jgi:hypothetical protein|uniref:hypothetical protein n=1 Tax=Lacrimispora sp. TaxID=2719234 RepID=UPI0028B09EF4|nr:hypothetical protein [Lacrimispora sp.]